jgi:hypothetical protein
MKGKRKAFNICRKRMVGNTIRGVLEEGNYKKDRKCKEMKGEEKENIQNRKRMVGN